MKKIAVQQALGQTLCHDMTAILADGFKGVRFRRGHVITEEDIPVLLDMGKEHIFVWEPEADEVHEEDAAIALTQVMAGSGIAYSGPSEGKMTITAQVDGLFQVHSAGLRRINTVPDYTVACIPGNTPVKAGQKVAGARIVPLVTKRDNVDAAVAIARECAPIFSVKPFRKLKTGVVITGSEVYYGRIQDAFEPILTPKLQGYGAEILGFTKCPDDLDKILAAIAAFRQQGAELILLTGGMSVDPDDLTPTAIRTLGGEFITQGVPMQPGNMLTIAYMEGCTLVGVPGASMHSPVTSLEVFLPRIFAGDKITKQEIAGYGEGGLCQNCPTCHFPNCSFGRYMP
jgi:molybdenum cofactor synthesis domain-containing protein